MVTVTKLLSPLLIGLCTRRDRAFTLKATNRKSRQWTYCEISDLKFEISELSFRELEAFTSALLPVFLPLFDARVACDQSRMLQRGPQIGVVFDQRAGNAVPDCACLSCRAATGHVCQYIKFVRSLSQVQGLPNNHAQR